MTEQERINENLQRQIDAQNARVSNVLTKVDMLISEMHDRDNQRAEEIRSSIDSISKHIRNLTITSMAAIGGMTVAVGAMVATVIYSLLRN